MRGAAPPEAAWASLRERREANHAVLLRTPSEQGLSEAQREALADLRAIALEMSDLRAPDGYPAIVRALEALVAATPPTDFARIDTSGDDGPYRVGVRDGKPFAERVKP
jgi:hypothetical protein